MAQNYSYPSASTVTITGIGSPNNAAIPPDSVLIAGENPSGDQKVIQTDATGNLLIAATQLPSTLGQKVMASSVAVVIASNQSAVPSSQSGTWNINNVSGTVSLPTGASTSALQSTISGQLPATLGAKVTASSLAVNIASDQTVPVSAASLPLPAGASTSANQTTGNTSLSSIDTKTPALGQALAAASVPVVLTASQLSTLTPLTSVTTSETTSSTATLTNVSGSATSVSILASNASRKNAMFFNDSSATLYLKFGTTASTTSYTVQLVSNAYYELPVGKIYTGAIDGIWSAANGAVRVTELT
jgi:hypothetical protein